MSSLSDEQRASREKTLLVSLLLSAPGAVVTGLAVLASASSTQLADFIRRTMEAVALFVSWWVFRRLHGDSAACAASAASAASAVSAPDAAERERLERVAALSVAAAMMVSGVIMIGVALSRLPAFEPGGNVVPGLIIAVLGVLTNGWFWRRYRRLTGERYDAVIAAQQQLYRAKTVVDVCVVGALGMVVVAPRHAATPYVDVLGSVAVAGYLVFSGWRTARSQVAAGVRDRSSVSP